MHMWVRIWKPVGHFFVLELPIVEVPNFDLDHCLSSTWGISSKSEKHQKPMMGWWDRAQKNHRGWLAQNMSPGSDWINPVDRSSFNCPNLDWVWTAVSKPWCIMVIFENTSLTSNISVITHGMIFKGGTPITLSLGYPRHVVLGVVAGPQCSGLCSSLLSEESPLVCSVVAATGINLRKGVGSVELHGWSQSRAWPIAVWLQHVVRHTGGHSPTWLFSNTTPKSSISVWFSIITHLFLGIRHWWKPPYADVCKVIRVPNSRSISQLCSWFVPSLSWMMAYHTLRT